jgi:hypothetical protein
MTHRATLGSYLVPPWTLDSKAWKGPRIIVLA